MTQYFVDENLKADALATTETWISPGAPPQLLVLHDNEMCSRPRVGKKRRRSGPLYVKDHFKPRTLPIKPADSVEAMRVVMKP